MMIIKPCLILLVCMLLACTEQRDSTDRNTGAAAMADDNSNIPQHLQAWHAQARDDLAQRLQIKPLDIATLHAEDVTWSDGATGCPEPACSTPRRWCPVTGLCSALPAHSITIMASATKRRSTARQSAPENRCPTSPNH